jgi:hypothetical protein
VPAAVTVTINDPPGNGNDRINFVAVAPSTSTILSGSPIDLGSNSYLGSNNSTGTFSNSAVTLQNGGRTIRITLSSCSGTCGFAVATSSSLSFTTVTTISGTDGRTASGTATKTGYKLF